jgi:glycosyltransferase involved in cell wall biosynthesis
MGARTHEQLRYIYASSDIFVMPSITARDGDKEGFGLVMLEAFASGLPVVASRSGGITDLIKDGINGYLTEEKDIKEIADRINIVLNDKNIYNKYVTAAYETAGKYDYKVIAKKYNDFIDSIMEVH